MSGDPSIFVDFSRRDLEGRFYLVRLGAFDHKPELGEEFIATDLEEFDGIRCEVLGVDLRDGRVYYRPMNPTDVPGTAPRSDEAGATVDQPAGVQLDEAGADRKLELTTCS